MAFEQHSRNYVLPQFVNESHSPSNTPINTVADLIDFNADMNPNHLFCLQMTELSLGPPPRHITNQVFRDTISVCQTWVLGHIREAQRPVTASSGELLKGAPVAILMDSGLELLIHLFALMGLGIPVRFPT